MSWLQIAEIVLLIAVFATGLFVASELLAIRSDLNDFKEFRREFASPHLFHPRIRKEIEAAESKAEVKLSWGARQLLATPVAEALELGEVDWNQVEKSINAIVDGAKEEAPSDRKLNALHIIAGFHLKFCSIPPFCKRR